MVKSLPVTLRLAPGLTVPGRGTLLPSRTFLRLDPHFSGTGTGVQVCLFFCPGSRSIAIKMREPYDFPPARRSKKKGEEKESQTPVAKKSRAPLGARWTPAWNVYAFPSFRGNSAVLRATWKNAKQSPDNPRIDDGR